MECNICQNQIKNSCQGSCSHHYCYECLIKWCNLGGTTCPICKVLIREIRLDREFDRLLNKINNNNDDLEKEQVILQKNCKFIQLNTSLNKPIKYTLKNNAKGPGVVVSSVSGKIFSNSKHLKKNDIIININKIPIVSHKQAIEIINKCTEANTELNIYFLKPNLTARLMQCL